LNAVRRTEIEIGLNAVIVAVDDGSPLVLAINADAAGVPSLPFGPFDPIRHRTFEIGLRNWVEEQTSLSLGYVEQLYTFGDRGRHAREGDSGHVVSVGYLALTRRNSDADRALASAGAKWRRWYDFFPWEDWREGRPDLLENGVQPALKNWVNADPTGAPPGRFLGHRDRFRQAFADDSGWDEERVLERYELLYEGGLAREGKQDGRVVIEGTTQPFGTAMRHDHRRILATAITRLRSKLKYRPVVFELMQSEFTLTELQQTVEAIAGRHLYKQNFRRLVEAARLVEPTGGSNTSTGGRPAALFRFRREVLKERPGAGLRFGHRG
jgi:hypothetical protein